MSFAEEIKKVFKGYDIEIAKDQVVLFEKYYKLIADWNKKFNLTAIIEQADVILKHFLDSVLVCEHLKEDASLIDVGAGAGLPGIPIKIMRPDIEVVMVDGSSKRVTFLNEVIAKLELKGIKAIHKRCELLAQDEDYREGFDYCVARAVAEVNTLVEYCLPFVKLFGHMIAYKSKNIDFELEQGANAIELLGGKVVEVKKIKLKELNAQRCLLFVQKKFKSPIKFPRGQNKPRTNPL